jgi:uncharacterized protein YbjT (DUF2867 family)
MPLVLVSGGTGTLGSQVVQILEDQGNSVRVLSRLARDDARVEWAVGDLRNGKGVDAAVLGVDVIVHCATRMRDAAMTENLVRAARNSGQPHLVYISIVGIDRVPFFYYRQKLAAEKVIENSDLPNTILRATQFHDLILRICSSLSRTPVMFVPSATDFQPVDAGEVASRLVELASGAATGRVPDMGGPEVLTVTELARTYLEAAGKRRRIASVHIPGRLFDGYRRGGHLAPDHLDGSLTFAEFLARRLGNGNE